MNYKDIPKLTRSSSYTIQWELGDIGFHLKSLDENLIDARGNITDKKGLELNPDFQRGHVWTEEQQVKFVEYLFKGGMSGRDIYFNNASHMRDYDEPYLSVDGLQRLTACLRFEKNEIKVFGHFKDEFEGRIPHDIYLNIHINDLQTRKEVLEWYLELNSEGTPHQEEELARVRGLIQGESN